MALLDKKKYQVKRIFGYQKPMQVGEEILLTDFEAGRYSDFIKPSESPIENKVNELDEKPNKKLSNSVGRRKNK